MSKQQKKEEVIEVIDTNETNTTDPTKCLRNHKLFEVKNGEVKHCHKCTETGLTEY